jgi:putative nucleotidyltransferase with HDIG domain
MGSESLPLIDVDRLQIGMYVVLDVGWRQHPFAFNNFTIRTEEQLQQLRTLGPRKLRYSPERSSKAPLPVAPNEAAAALAPKPHAPDVAPADAALEPGVDEPTDPLLRQQASLSRVEAGYLQAAQRHQRVLRDVLIDPVQARQAAEQLGDSVRLLSPRAGDSLSSHEIAVSVLAALLARECGFSAAEIRDTVLAGLLHDIGKLKIPSFLHEDGGWLTRFERGSYQRHVELGVEVARSLDLPDTVVRAIGEHHERVDGSGFPVGKRGDRLSPIGRLLAIVNRYQNLVCPLHAANGVTPHVALKRMYSAERPHFDPVYLASFVRLLGIYPPGTLVELTDHRMAMVVAARPGMSLAPTVQLLDTPEGGEASLAFDLDPGSELRVRVSLQPEQLNPRWAQRARQLARAAVFIEPLSASGAVAPKKAAPALLF